MAGQEDRKEAKELAGLCALLLYHRRFVVQGRADGIADLADCVSTRPPYIYSCSPTERGAVPHSLATWFVTFCYSSTSAGRLPFFS